MELAKVCLFSSYKSIRLFSSYVKFESDKLLSVLTLMF